MSKIFIPTNKPEDWKVFLADPRHWKTGFSARSLAYCWQEADDFPKCVRSIFKKSGVDIFKDIELLFAFPEYKVPLAGGQRSSQSDIFILAKSGQQLITIAVEGKVAEDFGQTVDEWRLKKDERTHKEERLKFLLQEICMGNVSGNVRYQLLHRSASAIIEAKRFNAKNTLMLIHSFSQTYEHFEDYSKFLSLFGLIGEKDNLAGPININGINLFFGWAKGDKKFLLK